MTIFVIFSLAAQHNVTYSAMTEMKICSIINCVIAKITLYEVNANQEPSVIVNSSRPTKDSSKLSVI